MSDETEQPVTRVTRAIEARIVTRELAAKSQLPTIRQLQEELGVAYNTVQAGLRDLRDRGIIYSHKGKGSFVAEDALNLLSRSSSGRGLEERVEFLERALATVLERLDRLDEGAGR
ncbi:GntR family transcriptional regulator [Streptomyces sp. NPDC058525]|uniref:GntR family transcriptional regulator n=1 Tax=Streptomyces sp. NPDC058525 TaxID=3346538 RepID=UPI00364B4172